MRRDWVRFSHGTGGQFFLVAVAFGTMVVSSVAQDSSATTDSPARFVPAENLAGYVEFDGLAGHNEGWQKTAAYRILNETPTGGMLEELFKQVYARFPIKDLSASDALNVVKHVAKSGFLAAVIPFQKDDKPGGTAVYVFRKAFANREVRPLFARLMQSLPTGGGKSQAVVKSGHKLVTGKRNNEEFCWWVEETKKEDLILVLGTPGGEDLILDTLDGKRPSALTHPIRVEMLKAQANFEQTSFGFIDPVPVKRFSPMAGIPQLFDQIHLNRFDFVSGFQADALATVSRFHRIPAEGTGVETEVVTGFDKSSIPPVPAGVKDFTVVGLNLKALAGAIKKSPQLAGAYEQMIATLNQKAKIRFEEDLLTQLGPKLTAYILPTKASESPSAMLPNAMKLIQTGVPGLSSIPKATILVDVVNSATFGTKLDQLMSYVNRQMKASFSAPPGPGSEAPPPPPGGSRGRGGPGGPGGPPTPEFRVMSGETKSYVFTVPPELSSRFDSSFRPTIRLGSKQVAIASSADLARQALEAKGSFTPPPEIAAAFAALPTKLNWLLVVDPRDSTPEILASFPAKLQAGINTVLLATAAGPATAPGSTPSGGEAPGGGNESRSRNGMRPAASAPGTLPIAPAGGNPTPPAAAGAAPTGTLVLQVDPSKLPSVDDTKKLLFPAIYTIDQEGNAVRFTTRAAFPPIPDPSIMGLIFMATRSRLNPATAGAPSMPAAAPTASPAAVAQPPTAGATDAERANRQRSNKPMPR